MQTQKKVKNDKNLFLYEHFEKELKKVQYMNNPNLKFSIQKILRSLTKYPMPILNAKQAVMIEGIGEKSAATIGKLCKKQYEFYLIDGCQSDAQSQSSLFSNFKSEFVPEIQSQVYSEKKIHYENQEDGDNSIVISKQKNKINFEINSNPWAILLSLYNFNIQTHKNFASKKEIKYYCELQNEVFPCEVKSFQSLPNLVKKLLVNQLEFGDEQKFSLTEEGKNVAKSLLDHRMIILEQDKKQPSQDFLNFQYQKPSPKKKTKKKKEKISIVNEVKSDEEKSEKKVVSKRRKTKSLKKNQDTTKKSQQDQKVKSSENQKSQQNLENQIHIIEKNNIEKYQIILIIDNREVFRREHDESRKIIKKDLNEKYGIQDCSVGQLPIGDFMWVIKIQEYNKPDPQIYPLDTIIERKTYDDLASSMQDKRYKDQKSRLKKSGIKNIFYLIEGSKLSQNYNMQTSSLELAIISTSVCDGFKIQKTQSLQDTIDFLAKLHLIIVKTFKQNYQMVERLNFAQTLDQFLQKNTKHLNHTVSSVFGNMLRSMKQCSQESTQQILDTFQTPLQLFKQINSQGTTENRLKFLKEKCPQIKNKRLLQNIVTIFSFEVYPNLLEN